MVKKYPARRNATWRDGSRRGAAPVQRSAQEQVSYTLATTDYGYRFQISNSIRA